MALSGLFSAVPFLFPQTASAASSIDITNISQLRDAIENQADNQTWTIEPGNYGLTAFTDITAGCPSSCQTGWYFPITASNLTINGVGNPIIYGTGYTTNGAWSTQNLITIFGDNVTIRGLTLMPKVEPNKTIEVLGDSATITDTTIKPNTLTSPSEYNSIPNTQDRADEQYWGGSIYYNNATGIQTLSNVTIENGGISDHASGATLNLTNVNLNYSTSVDWINAYRLATYGNTVNGSPRVTYHITSTLGNLNSVLDSIQNGDIIELDSNLSTLQQITLTKSITFNGNGYTISPAFAKTDNSNNSAIGIKTSGVTVNNLVEDGTNGSNLHGINIYSSTDVTLNEVVIKNNGHAGIVVNGSSVTVNKINTSGNVWGGINVDQGSGVTSSAVLTVNGVSSQAESTAIWIDDINKNASVNDANHQYSYKDTSNTRVYSLLKTTQVSPDPSGNATVNTTTPTVVVSSPTMALNINISGGTNNASIDYSALKNTATTAVIPQTIINSPIASILIPATQITASSPAWDGTISAPTIQSTSSVSLGSSKTVASVIEVGFGDVTLTFDQAVRILVPGQAGKLVGFVRSGNFTQITTVCSADSQTAGNALVAGGDCYINSGGDLVVWTKHFTKFVTYSSAVTTAVKTKTTYTVRSGDTMGAIAARYGLTLAELIKLNPNAGHPAGNYDLILPGDILTLSGTPSATTTSASTGVLGESTQGGQIGSAASTNSPNNQVKAATTASPSLVKESKGLLWYEWLTIAIVAAGGIGASYYIYRTLGSGKKL